MSRFFSTKLYIQGLKKIRAAGIATAIIIIISSALFPLITLISSLSTQNDAWGYTRILEVKANLVSPLSIFIIFLAPIVTFSMFSFLNDRCKSDFYHSLPQRRECVFISMLASTLTWLIGTIVASHIINAILWILVPNYKINLTAFLLSLVTFIILTLLVTAFATLAVTVTGTSTSNTLITLLFALFFRIIAAIFLHTVTQLSSVFVAEYSPLKFLSFSYYLPAALLGTLISSTNISAFSNVPMLITSFVTSLALLALSTLLYCKRKSESAGKSAPSRFWQHVWRIAITLPLVLITCSSIVVDGFESSHIVLLVFSLIIYLVFELATTKKIKNMVRSIPLFAVTIFASIAVILLAAFTGAVVDSKTPAADEIEGISIVGNNYTISYEDLIIADTFITDDNVAQIVSTALEYSATHSIKPYQRVEMIIHIKTTNGNVITRRIFFTEQEASDLKSTINSSAELNNALLALPSDSEINSIGSSIGYDDKCYELWQSFCEEYQTLSDDEKIALKESTAVYYDLGSIGQLYVSGYHNLQYFNSTYYIVPTLMPQTAIKYMEMFNAVQNNMQELIVLNDTISGITLSGNEYGTSAITISPIIQGDDKQKLYIGGRYGDSNGNETKIYEKFSNAIDIIANMNNATSISDLSKVYKVSIEVYGVIPSTYADTNEVWYESIYITLYLNITDEQYQSLANIME